MCRCEFSDRLFMPACDYVWAVARYDHMERLWRMTVEHHHSGTQAMESIVAASFTDSGDVLPWLSNVVGELLRPDWDCAGLY